MHREPASSGRARTWEPRPAAATHGGRRFEPPEGPTQPSRATGRAPGGARRRSAGRPEKRGRRAALQRGAPGAKRRALTTSTSGRSFEPTAIRARSARRAANPPHERGGAPSGGGRWAVGGHSCQLPARRQRRSRRSPAALHRAGAVGPWEATAASCPPMALRGQRGSAAGACLRPTHRWRSRAEAACPWPSGGPGEHGWRPPAPDPRGGGHGCQLPIPGLPAVRRSAASACLRPTHRWRSRASRPSGSRRSCRSGHRPAGRPARDSPRA